MSSKKNKKSKATNDSTLYEFANDQLGENKDTTTKDLAEKTDKKQKSSKKNK